MLYRDLLPDRLGGRFTASHIRIPEGGPVLDDIHFHRVRFQMIYCYRGWARLVYEDQGAPFVLEAGDCVLQPSTIRHRVLENSDGLEAIEIVCPAEHETQPDPDMSLPNATLNTQRRFEGQRFVHHVAAQASWEPGHLPGFESRVIGLAEASEGLAEARVCRPRALPRASVRHDAELHFVFVLEGEVGLEYRGEPVLSLRAGDAVSIPAARAHRWTQASPALELLEVSLPARPRFELLED